MSSGAPFSIVFQGTDPLGFLILRGISGVEAFDRDGASIGMFASDKEAADAVTAQAVPA
jgi:hypothetical protein